MIHFKRTEDWDTVKRIVTDAKVWPHVTDDSCPAPEEWEPNPHDSIWHVLVMDDGELLGLFTLVPQNSICYEIHTALLPCAWGARARDAARLMARWVFQNTPCRRVVTTVPAYNRLALRFAKAAGMAIFGVNDRSYLKQGMLHDQILLGLSEEKKCQ